MNSSRTSSTSTDLSDDYRSEFHDAIKGIVVKTLRRHTVARRPDRNLKIKHYHHTMQSVCRFSTQLPAQFSQKLTKEFNQKRCVKKALAFFEIEMWRKRFILMYKNQRALSIDYQSKSLHNTSKSRGVCVARVYRWRNRRKKSQSRRDRVHPGVFSFHFRLHCLQLTSTQSIDFTITCRWRESTFSLDEQYSNKCNAIQV